jgi:hypothetical protein
MFYIDIDFADISRLESHLQEAAETAMKKATQSLAAATHAHLIELANKQLKSRREPYISALSMRPDGDDVWLIVLDKSASWIEDGKKEGETIDDLLKSKNAKTAADGSKYAIIGFNHGPGLGKGGGATQAQLDLVSTVKAELKKRSIPYGKIETDSAGAPKIGMLHSLSIKNGPIKTQEGPGQGRGPLGQPRQGSTGKAFLEGIQIHQKSITNPDGSKGTKRSIVSFRTVSSKQKGSGKWVHPGLEGKKLMDEAAAWALNEFDKTIAPAILRDLEGL